MGGWFLGGGAGWRGGVGLFGVGVGGVGGVIGPDAGPQGGWEAHGGCLVWKGVVC